MQDQVFPGYFDLKIQRRPQHPGESARVAKIEYAAHPHFTDIIVGDDDVGARLTVGELDYPAERSTAEL